MLTPTAVDFCCARATSACTAWVSGVMETAGGAGVCAKAGRPRRRRRESPRAFSPLPPLRGGPSPLTPLPPHSRPTGRGEPDWIVLALLPLLPVGGRAMGEEGRGDEGLCIMASNTSRTTSRSPPSTAHGSASCESRALHPG